MEAGAAPPEDPYFGHLTQTQKARGVLHTRRDTWMTAAVMTTLFIPWGTPFGLVALLLMRGAGRRIDTDCLDAAEQQLARARRAVLIGTVVGAVAVAVIVVGGLVRLHGIAASAGGSIP